MGGNGSGRPQSVSTGDMITAIIKTTTMEAAARELGCTAPAINARAKLEPAVKQALVAQSQELEESLAAAIPLHRGILSKVAEDIGLGSGRSVMYHISRSARLTEIFEDARYRQVDRAEDNIFKAVDNGDLTYSWKVLQTLGKDRGYTERREIDQTVTHSLDEASTASLVGMLDKMASISPEAVEAEFEVLSAEDREMLSEELGTAVEESSG